MFPESYSTFELPLARVLEDRAATVRTLFGDLDDLAIRLMTEGQRVPIKVREEAGEYYVVDGHRRQRAFARALQLRIVSEDGRWVVYEGEQPLRDAPGPVHSDYKANVVLCRRIECGPEADQVLAAEFVHNQGKPFTALERSLFLSRLLRQGGPAAGALALKLGFLPSEIDDARRLYVADPRLLDQVSQGRLSPRLALRLLRRFPAGEQIARLSAARAAAEARRRESVEAGDFDWTEEGPMGAEEREEVEETDPDPIHARLDSLVLRLGEVAQDAPNPVAEGRLSTLLLVYRYVVGQIAYDKLESHLMGRS